MLKRESTAKKKTKLKIDIYSEETVSDIAKTPEHKKETKRILEGEYSINVTSVHNKKGQVRRRVKTNYTKHEIDKIMEHKKNNIMINRGTKMSLMRQDEGDFLRVSTNNPKPPRNQSNRPFKRSNTIISGRSQSIYNRGKDEEDSQEAFMDRKSRLDHLKAKLTVTSKDHSKDKQRSMGTSIEKSQINTSIIKENSKDSSVVQNYPLNRDKSMSDPVKSYKLRYKSDNVLGQTQYLDEDLEYMNKAISLADFQIVRELGQGKFGKVVQVRRKTNDDEFAVKLIPIMNQLDKHDEANLNSESEIFKTISDKYVVKAFYW